MRLATVVGFACGALSAVCLRLAIACFSRRNFASLLAAVFIVVARHCLRDQRTGQSGVDGFYVIAARTLFGVTLTSYHRFCDATEDLQRVGYRSCILYGKPRSSCDANQWTEVQRSGPPNPISIAYIRAFVLVEYGI